jgi:hypothetical protein
MVTPHRELPRLHRAGMGARPTDSVWDVVIPQDKGG